LLLSLPSLLFVILHALIGLTFTLISSLKLYGLSKGIVGGADKPLGTQLCGT
jgi:hypothetical protein